MRTQHAKIEIVFPGDPRPQPRPTADGRGKFIRVVSAKAGSLVIPFKEQLNWQARRHMTDIQALPAVGPVFLEIECVWKRPGDKKKAAPPDQRIWRMDAKRNDWDNLAKSVCDALNEVFYLDDGQIVGGMVKKFYGRIGEDSHVRVVMRNLLEEGSRNEG